MTRSSVGTPSGTRSGAQSAPELYSWSEIRTDSFALSFESGEFLPYEHSALSKFRTLILRFSPRVRAQIRERRLIRGTLTIKTRLAFSHVSVLAVEFVRLISISRTHWFKNKLSIRETAIVIKKKDICINESDTLFFFLSLLHEYKKKKKHIAMGGLRLNVLP